MSKYPFGFAPQEQSKLSLSLQTVKNEQSHGFYQVARPLGILLQKYVSHAQQ
jgi:hypothetical protein